MIDVPDAEFLSTAKELLTPAQLEEVKLGRCPRCGYPFEGNVACIPGDDAPDCIQNANKYRRLQILLKAGRTE